jgi:hypothetical protein
MMNFKVFLINYKVQNPGIGDMDVKLVKYELERFKTKREAVKYIYGLHPGKCLAVSEDKTRFFLDDGNGNRHQYLAEEKA